MENNSAVTPCFSGLFVLAEHHDMAAMFALLNNLPERHPRLNVSTFSRTSSGVTAIPFALKKLRIFGTLKFDFPSRALTNASALATPPFTAPDLVRFMFLPPFYARI